jgi:hypothetical protein
MVDRAGYPGWTGRRRANEPNREHEETGVVQPTTPVSERLAEAEMTQDLGTFIIAVARATNSACDTPVPLMVYALDVPGAT